MSSYTGVQELVGENEPNTDVSQHRRGSNIIKQVPHDPSKRTMINLDGGEFTDTKGLSVVKSEKSERLSEEAKRSALKRFDSKEARRFTRARKSVELFKWEGLSDVLVHDAWENSMKKRYPDIMSKARGESVKWHRRPVFNLRAAYNGALVKKYGSDPANHPIYDDELWKQCAGDDKKGGVFGWGYP
ncbi:hypothetical protein Tco_1401469 [Tanacetum coccineum]